ncbi:MAG: ABC transporter substrate-binding protein, partial [Pirellulaceae bacterium]|nr:ABC transporter substrate-binding protein [Pirellulaceae bacterium]
MSRPSIISLLPGATEWVCELGLSDCLVGVSHECDYPPAVMQLPKVTRSRIDINQSSQQIDQVVREHSETKTPIFELDHECVARLQPTLILTQTLCNVCAVSESDVRRSLRSSTADCDLLDLSAMTFSDVIADAQRIIHATASRDESITALKTLQDRIDAVKTSVAFRSDANDPRPKVTLLEWTDPLFCAGHWTPELIHWAGGEDPIGRVGEPSRQIEYSELIDANPDILLIACCGLDRQRGLQELASLSRRDDWQRLGCVQNRQVHVFDGSAWFNRPGPRLVDALQA